MKTNSEIKNIAISVLRHEANAIIEMGKRIDSDFVAVVDCILRLKGRVIITGIGKSAIIAQKIVATLNSTGTPSIFMHAADAIHGDLGIIQKDDLILVISKSGNTPEIRVLVPLLKQTQNLLVAMVGNRESYLAEQADYILDTEVDREACPHNLAPTTSTTAQLAMGDALAVCLIESKDFSERDFARYHPGGILGKKLYLTVGDIAAPVGGLAAQPDTGIRELIVAITASRLGAVAIVDNSVIVGIVTDGDVRRMLESNQRIEDLRAKDIMGLNPKTIEKNQLAVEALQLMRENHISQLLVIEQGTYYGIVHLHDLLKEGIL